MFLDREALLNKDDLERKTVEIGDDEVNLRELSAGEYIAAMERFGEGDGDTGENIRASMGMVVIMLCGQDDSPLFPDDAEHEEIDAALVDKMPTRTITLLINSATEILGLEKDQVKKDVGNSEEIPSDSSSSDSPRISDSQRDAA